ncbi:hypothetical protein [Paludisphaera sp.]|uniref:hypothetical protein n=1 Tax=Paludisphaera sp. TaxID=2017432 RepID=UPI00301E4E3F
MIQPSHPTFPGLWPYIERAAEGRHVPFLGRGRGLWHCKQVQDSLGQLPGLDEAARRELLAHVGWVRDSLAAALEGIDLAIRDSTGGLDAGPAIPSPAAPAAPAEASPHRETRGRRRRD